MLFQDTATVKIFLALLRSGMYGTPVPEAELPESIEWPDVIELARKQVVQGIIVDSIRHLPENLRPDSEIMANLNKFAIGLFQTNIILDRTVARLAKFFAAHNIPGVLLKGQGVARYYHSPQMRHSGDIDYYVGKKNYEKAVDLCNKYLITDNSGYEENSQHYNFNLNGVEIELHRLASSMYTPSMNKRFQEWVVEELESSGARRVLKLADTEVVLPSYNFDAVYIFYHAWRHFITGGIGLRQLCDWTMIFHSKSADIDKKELVSTLEKFKLVKGWKLFACIAVEKLGLPADKMPLYDPAFSKRAGNILEEIIEGGNFGYYAKSNASLISHKYGLRDEIGKFRAITGYFVSLFPIIPGEATVIYAGRLAEGFKNVYRRVKRKVKR